MDNLVLYVTCPILGGAGAWLISRWGTNIGLLDRSNDRSSHEGVVPKGGGVGILAAFILSALVLKTPAVFWISATFLSLFSLCGDRIKISPKIRLPVQFIAALAFLLPAYFLPPSIVCLLPSDLWPPISVLCLFVFAVFIVGTANYYNFMDGINGIAGITGMVGFGLLGFYAFLSGCDSSFVTLSVCISLACLGFLPFNMQKAKVFMGDVGSILLGFVFACMVVWLSKNLLDFLCLSAFMLPFYADELTTTVVRLRDRENLLHAHRRHFYQLLSNERGVSHWKISAGYGMLQLAVGVSILLFKDMGSIAVIFILAIYFGAFAGMGFAVRRKLE